MKLFGLKQPKTFGPHDFAVAGHVANPIPEPKKLGLTHSPRVVTVYPDDGVTTHSPKEVHNALVKMRKELDKKLG